MKDLVENRSKITSKQKVRLFYLSLRENGVLWTGMLATYYLTSAVAEKTFSHLQTVKREKGLPGTSSATMNREIWNSWDWSAGGEEWTLSEEWKDSLIRTVLRRYIPFGMNVLEIGPGGGRWTQELLKDAAHLTSVDISEKCIALCREKFKDAQNATFLVTQGSDVSGVPDQSIDALWSFDVFVHINQAEVANYVKDFRRVMHPGSIGVIHHGKFAGKHGGWRSDLTAEAFGGILQEEGFCVREQFESWQDGEKSYPVGLYEDVVTVFTG